MGERDDPNVERSRAPAFWTGCAFGIVGLLAAFALIALALDWYMQDRATHLFGG